MIVDVHGWRGRPVVTRWSCYVMSDVIWIGSVWSVNITLLPQIPPDTKYLGNWIATDKYWYQLLSQWPASNIFSERGQKMFPTNRSPLSWELLRQWTLSSWVHISWYCAPGPWLKVGKLMIRLYLDTFQHYKAQHLDSFQAGDTSPDSWKSWRDNIQVHEPWH